MARHSTEFAFPRLADISRIPALESFCMSGFQDYWFDCGKKRSFTKLKHLELSECSLPPPELSRLLDSCPNLASFALSYGSDQTDGAEHYAYDYDISFPGQPNVVSKITWQAITESLRCRAQTLEKLVLSVDNSTCWRLVHDMKGDDQNESNVIGSIKEFSALKHLTLPSDTLIGSFEWYDKVVKCGFGECGRADGSVTDRLDTLPPCIEFLTITDISTEIILLHLENVIGIIKTRFPCLRRIKLKGQNPSDPEYDEPGRIARLKDELHTMGITLELPNDWGISTVSSEEDNETGSTPATMQQIAVVTADLHKSQDDLYGLLDGPLATILGDAMRSARTTLVNQPKTTADLAQAIRVSQAVSQALDLQDNRCRAPYMHKRSYAGQ